MNVDRRLIAKLSDSVKQISSHWMLVDDALPPEFPLMVLSRYDRAGFVAKWASRSVLDAQLADAKQALKLAIGSFQKAKMALFARMRGFRTVMSGYWIRSEFYVATPLLPGADAGDEVFFDAAHRMALVWRAIAEVDPLPPTLLVVLSDGYSWVGFAADIAALSELREGVREARLHLRIARGRVQVFQEAMVATVMAYGHSARGRLGADSPLLDLIPRTWPERRGENP